MRRVITTGVLVLTILLFNHTAKATIVEVDVTIKSVDVKARGITVSYKAKGEQKSIDLDVSRKAEITVNGKQATLDSVKPGQKAKISYEKELQVVTKIGITGSGTVASPEVMRITLNISEFGDGKFRIEKTTEPPENDFQGTPFKFSQWPHTKATKGQDGMFRLVHDFSDPDDLALLVLVPPVNVSIEKDSGGLVFTHGLVPGRFDGKKGAAISYGKKLRLPLEIQCDIAAQDIQGFVVKVTNPPHNRLSCNVWSNSSGFDGPFELQTIWTEVGDGGKQNSINLFKQSSVALREPFDERFRLPLPNVKIDDAMLFELIAFGGDGRSIISRLEVRGRIAPIFRIGLDEKQGMIFAKTVFPNGLGEKAGIQTGDVISAINGKKPQTMQETVDMLSNLTIGEEAVFAVQRGEKTQELRVVAE